MVIMHENEKINQKQEIEPVKKAVRTWHDSIIGVNGVVSNSWRRYRGHVLLGYMMVAIIAFIILAILAKTAAYFTFDLTITRAVQTFQAGWFSTLMYSLSWIGFPPQTFLIPLLVLLLLYVNGLKWETAVGLISLLLSSGLGLGIKTLVDRPRPSTSLINVIRQLYDYSFPSGHVLFFTTFFGFMFFLAYTLLKHSWLRATLLVIFGGMVALIGVSRIYEGQHWASDVIASYLLGSVWLALSILFYRWGKPRFFLGQPDAKETPNKK